MIRIGRLRFYFLRCPRCAGHGFDGREHGVINDTMRVPFIELVHTLPGTIENSELVRYIQAWDHGNGTPGVLYCEMCYGMGYIRVASL